MDTLTSLRVFREVVDCGSFAGAAQRLDVSTAMASKHVAHLERRLGARLLHRTSRRLSLTEAGSVYLEQCREALDALGAGEAAIAEQLEAPRGVLKVTAPVWFANRRFAQALERYGREHPAVTVDLRLENRRVDLVEDGYDLALRVSREPAPSLIVRPICDVRFALVATPALLARHPPVALPADLGAIGAILPTYVKLDAFWPDGAWRQAVAALRPTLKTDDTTLAYHAVHAGIGMAFLPLWLTSDDLASGALLQVLPGFSMPPAQLVAAYTSRRYLTAKVRSFIDFIGRTFGSG